MHILLKVLEYLLKIAYVAIRLRRRQIQPIWGSALDDYQ
jgi:hypothetical protein